MRPEELILRPVRPSEAESHQGSTRMLSLTIQKTLYQGIVASPPAHSVQGGLDTIIDNGTVGPAESSLLARPSA